MGLFGLKNQFSLEYEIIPDPAARVIIGRFRMWANSQEIGDFSDVLVLGAVQFAMEISLKEADRRVNLDLFAKPKEEAFNFLRDALYGNSPGRDFKTVEALAIKYGACNLKDLGVSSFDGKFVFLISGISEQRLLWRRGDEVGVKEAKFPVGTYEAVAGEYLSAYTKETLPRREADGPPAGNS